MVGLEVQITGQEFNDLLAIENKSFKFETTARDPAVYQYTSGTTREMPEAVHHTHGSLVTLTLATLYATGIRPGDRFMSPTSPAWGHGLWHGTIAPLSLGVTMASYAGKFDAGRCIEAMANLHITNFSAAATHYRLMRRWEMPRNLGISCQETLVYGRASRSETGEWILKLMVHRQQVYGTTEVGVILPPILARGI